MIGWTDLEVRNFDLKMQLLHDPRGEELFQIIIRANDIVEQIKRDGIEIGRLRIGYNIWDALQESHPGAETLFGYEVEVDEDEADLVEVVKVSDREVALVA